MNYTNESESLKEEEVAALNVATDPNPADHDNHVFILKKTSKETYRVYELDSTGASCSISPEKVDLRGSNNLINSALAVGTNERVYANQFSGAFAKAYLLGSLPRRARKWSLRARPGRPPRTSSAK